MGCSRKRARVHVYDLALLLHRQLVRPSDHRNVTITLRVSHSIHPFIHSYPLGRGSHQCIGSIDKHAGATHRNDLKTANIPRHHLGSGIGLDLNNKCEEYVVPAALHAHHIATKAFIKGKLLLRAQVARKDNMTELSGNLSMIRYPHRLPAFS